MKRFNWRQIEASIVDLEKKTGLRYSAKKAEDEKEDEGDEKEDEKEDEGEDEKEDEDEKEEKKESKKASLVVRRRVASTLERLADISDGVRTSRERVKLNGLMQRVAGVYEACDRSGVTGRALSRHLDAVDEAIGRVFPGC